MFGLLQFLIDREAKPLARAAVEAVSQPTKRAMSRLVWAAGFSIASLVLGIGAISIGAVALSAFLLEKLPDAQSVLGWSALALFGAAAVFALLATLSAKSVSASHMVREGQAVFDHEFHKQGFGVKADRSKARSGPADPIADSYAFARGFADGLRN